MSLQDRDCGILARPSSRVAKDPKKFGEGQRVRATRSGRQTDEESKSGLASDLVPESLALKQRGGLVHK